MQIFKGRSAILTVAPGYGDALKEDQEQQAHAAGRVVVEQFEHIDSALVMRKKERGANYQHGKKWHTWQTLHFNIRGTMCNYVDRGGAPA